MLEMLVVLTLIGLILSNSARMGVANPFLVYFIVWFAIFLVYFFFRTPLSTVSSEYLLVLFAVNLSVLFVALFFPSYLPLVDQDYEVLNFPELRIVSIGLAQIVVAVGLPFVYWRARQLSGGDTFSSFSYNNLRYFLSIQGESYGWFKYLFLLAFVLTSMHVILYLDKKIGILPLVGSIILSISYVYLSTMRTHMLMFLTLSVYPLVFFGKIRGKGVVATIIIFGCFFIFIGGMTGKGISFNADLYENFESLRTNIFAYSIAPLLAFEQFMNSTDAVDFGVNTFRFFIAIFYFLGFSDFEPPALVREYSYVPDATNVYTVYEVYYRDFSYFGFLAIPAIMMFHWWIYRKAKMTGGVWIFLCSASMYPLLMQFFQDQYMSLFSTWIQVIVWCVLFTRTNVKFSKG